MAVHTRIAPTPSGYLHTGNASNFLFADKLVKQHGGTLRLRIDDLDAPRTQPEYLQDIFDSLHWLNIYWQYGPTNAEEHTNQFSQKLRIPKYQEYINQLIETGNVFACTCSRKDLTYQHEKGIYTCNCRTEKLPFHLPEAALRIMVPPDATIEFTDNIKGLMSINLALTVGDFVIRRKDGIPAYQVASLCDDMDYGINTIVRGEDLLESTAAQLYLASLTGHKAFLQTAFYHHPLITDTTGKKLSKSEGSTSLKWMRENGKNLTF